MSCGHGTQGFQCDTIYTLGGTVSQEKATAMFNLGKELGLTECAARRAYEPRTPVPGGMGTYPRAAASSAAWTGCDARARPITPASIGASAARSHRVLDVCASCSYRFNPTSVDWDHPVT